jgi:GNAT superfamily N-acetyltransferase
MTEAKHRAVMRSPTYRPDLDLVAVAPEGSLAAFTLVWYDPLARLGLFEPMGCHPDHQRRGLATALLYEGLRRLASRGAQVAYVNAWGTDPAASLYQAAGFVEVARNYAWEKEMERSL